MTPGIPNGSWQQYRKRGLVRVRERYSKTRYSSPLFLSKDIYYKLKKHVVSKLTTHMKTKNFIIILSIVTLYSCKKTTEKTAKGLTELTENWNTKETSFWIEIKKDSSLTEIESSDTLKYPAFKVKKKFELKTNGKLQIKKSLLINSLSRSKVFETDIYSKKINANIKSRLYLTYDYLLKEYTIILLDTVATDEKRKSNKIQLDSMYKYAEKNNLYLCGTAANEILYKDIPEFPSMKEVSLDSALIIIDVWKNE
ncbi:hypothetical protein [Lacinutrix sp. Bg11-31]|uniref:hypothetical protein n=1 Tax=Lacinutrix sp. Bg11-31 TaxID=2057808 RepID=UPI000C31B72F|nr:hypothetical protein [Lacinutrix sp. Bg11-31]AUC80726.1 hypothetical protein CW733_00670 [Lacinutrix sp. Bg11-31]